MKKLQITSIWFPVAFVLKVFERFVARSENVAVLIISALLTLFFCFLKPTRKRTPIFLALLTLLALISTCGLFSVFDLCNFLTYLSLCCLSLAQFVKKPKIFLNCKYGAAIFMTCSLICGVGINLFVGGKFILTDPYPYILLYALMISGGISRIVAFYQLSMKFYDAGCKRLQTLENVNCNEVDDCLIDEP